MAKRTARSYRIAARKGWKTRVKGSWIRASRTAIKPGERVRISWQSFGESQTLGRVSVNASGYKDFFPRVTTGYTLTARGYGQVSVRGVTVYVEEEKLREYFVVLIFTTRKRGKTVTRRLYEAIVTMPDGSTDEEILKAYQEKIQEQHPKLHNREIERLLFGPNAGRTIKIVPRDTPGSDVPSGSIRANDARKPKKRK